MKGLELRFGSSDPVQAHLSPDSQDCVLLRLTRLEDPDGPDYDVDGLLEIQASLFRISHPFTYRTGELAELDESLRSLQAGRRAEARFTTLDEAFTVVIRPAHGDLFPVRVELELPLASASPVVLTGFAISRLGLIALARQVRQLLVEGGAPLQPA